VEVGRGAVEDAGGLAGTVEEEEGGDGGDVAEGLGGGGVGDGPVEIGAERRDGGADLVFGGFDGQGEDSEVVAVLALEFAEPFESGAAGRAPGGPELDEDDAAREIVLSERLAGEIGELEAREAPVGLGCSRVTMSFLPAMMRLIMRARSALNFSWLAALRQGA
jgi:hypothetical protein